MWPDAPDAFAPLSEVVTLKWNADGMRTAMTAIKSNEALSWAAVDLIVCSANRTPPAKKHLSSVIFPLSRSWAVGWPEEETLRLTFPGREAGYSRSNQPRKIGRPPIRI